MQLSASSHQSILEILSTMTNCLDTQKWSCGIPLTHQVLGFTLIFAQLCIVCGAQGPSHTICIHAWLPSMTLALASAPISLPASAAEFLFPHHLLIVITLRVQPFQGSTPVPKEQIQHLFLKAPFTGGSTKNLAIFVKLAGKKNQNKTKKTPKKNPQLYYKALACLSHCTSAKCISKSKSLGCSHL